MKGSPPPWSARPCKGCSYAYRSSAWQEDWVKKHGYYCGDCVNGGIAAFAERQGRLFS